MGGGGGEGEMEAGKGVYGGVENERGSRCGGGNEMERRLGRRGRRWGGDGADGEPMGRVGRVGWGV